MSHFEPIAGISLEQYAELCGLMSGTQPEETEKHARIAAERGVAGPAWEEAKAGTPRVARDEHGRIEDHYDEALAAKFKELLQKIGDGYAGR